MQSNMEEQTNTTMTKATYINSITGLAKHLYIDKATHKGEQTIIKKL